jgi:hypothetical protein
MKTVEEVARDVFDLLDDKGRMSKQSVRDIVRADREAVLRRVEDVYIQQMGIYMGNPASAIGISSILAFVKKEVCR